MKGDGVEIEAVILGLVPFDIHDQPYLTIYFAHDDDPETVLQAQLPLDAIYPHPHVNDRIRVHYVLQVPTRIDKQESV